MLHYKSLKERKGEQFKERKKKTSPHEYIELNTAEVYRNPKV